MSIEKNYNIRFIAAMALREKQIQQNYRPIISVHKWFARRPGTLFRGLLLSEFATEPVNQTFYQQQDFAGVTVADPFMGGGTPLLEANRAGCDVVGMDINPMATWIVHEEIDYLDLATYRQAVEELLRKLDADVGHLYKTRCPISGHENVDVKYFLWVKTTKCQGCSNEFDLFPGYILAEDVRHPKYIFVCASCGDLNEVSDPENPGRCKCNHELTRDGNVQRNKATCPHCGHLNVGYFGKSGPPSHRLFAIEYTNPALKGRVGRLFKKPDSHDLQLASDASGLYKRMQPRFVPDDAIPSGDETSRLHRWGYKAFYELFNDRQLLGLETSARIISQQTNPRVQRALATNLSDLLRYQNMLCRYDTMALKSLDIFSIHGFPVGYVQVESNFLGIRSPSGLPVGSGGWINITEKYFKAKRYCTEPFEIAVEGKKKISVPMTGEWIGEANPLDSSGRRRRVDLRCASALSTELEPNSVDAVFTDPPYYGMVQYGELMHFCYVWLRKLMGESFAGFESDTTRHVEELTGNDTAGRDISTFADGLASVYKRMARALKPGGPLAFTYHHNKQEAYLAVAVAILDSGLVCTASLPCPAEMGGSIHIHGTGSSIMDTIFVCRDPKSQISATCFESEEELLSILKYELDELREAGVKPTLGDLRCMAFGHLTRGAIQRLHPVWDATVPTREKLQQVKQIMDSLGSIEIIWDKLFSDGRLAAASEPQLDLPLSVGGKNAVAI